MTEHPHTEALRQILRTRPDYALVLPTGSGIAMLTGPENNDVIIIAAPEGTNLNDFTDEELNRIIVNTLK